MKPARSEETPRGGQPVGERIQKVLSRAGLASRREAERWLAEGRIRVNGTVISQPGTRVDPARDHIKVDGKALRPPSHHVYYLLNKPDGCVTTMKDPQARPVVTDLLRGVKTRVFPVGRLDFHTTGLLIFTNDGDLADRLMRPATGCPKTYLAKVKGQPSPAALQKVARGVVIDGQRALPCKVRPAAGARAASTESNTWIEIVLNEGRRNQIRKMFQQVGHPVSRLKRVAIGPIADRSLSPGQYRALTPDEVKRLRASLG